MIHMLSRFGLRPGASLGDVQDCYQQLFDHMRAADLVAATGEVGSRIADTPMDTDALDAPTHYVIMSFTNRSQLDASYVHVEDGLLPDGPRAAHNRLKTLITDPVFTCWEDAT